MCRRRVRNRLNARATQRRKFCPAAAKNRAARRRRGSYRHEVPTSANAPARRLILVTTGFTPAADLAPRLRRLAAGLLAQLATRGGVLSVHVRCDAGAEIAPQFTVCATAEKTGVDHVAVAVASAPEAAAELAFAKLSRVVATAAGIRKNRRPPSGPRPPETSGP
ncbi:MAG TPA: hypothetical protein VHD62_03185 [Opitutaceae bacterium]|nr:hypothetical protein [Opitutaceae bacterium]